MKTKIHHPSGIVGKIKTFVRNDPALFAGLVLVLAIVFYGLLLSFELLPEKAEPVGPKITAANGMVIEPGDSMDWIGMKVVPVSRSIRKEFKLPRKIKGMFVLDEGKGSALKYGVKTGDVIVSIGRKRVFDAKSFVDVANNIQYSNGILLEIYRDKKTSFMTIPFEYQNGPLMGPYKGSWQLGSPVFGSGIPYGPVYQGNNNQNQRF